jgi:hypothetical protein
MGSQLRMNGPRPALALVLAGVMGAIAVPRAARAEGVPPEVPPASIDVRAVAGFGAGIGVDAWPLGRGLRFDLDVQTAVPNEDSWGGLAVVFPIARSARSFFGLRAGDTVEYMPTRAGWVSGSQFAQAPDASMVGHLESARGSTLEGQLGVEAVLREKAVICCDDAALRTSSFGVRVALRGELAVSEAWALVAEAGLRTADHLLEIKVLPTLAAGVRVRL